jgi:dUTP pyrophosphatase
MASEANQSFFELKLWVSEDVVGLREKYTEAAIRHNAVSVPCIYESHLGEFDAGFDLFCPEMVVVASDTVKINHQVKCAMDKYTPDGWIGGKPVGYYLYPRSSTGTKTPLRLANSVGIIDSGYRGNIIAVFDNRRSDGDGYVVGAFNRVVQICPPDISYPMVVTMVNREEELGETNRSAGGFGSTGV